MAKGDMGRVALPLHIWLRAYEFWIMVHMARPTF